MSINSSTKLIENLTAALDAAVTDDKGLWVSGEETFWQSLRAGSSIEDALWDALDAAAIDQPLWLAGAKAFFGDDDKSALEKLKERIRTRSGKLKLFNANQFSPAQLAARG